jgi:hypothetical protein
MNHAWHEWVCCKHIIPASSTTRINNINCGVSAHCGKTSWNEVAPIASAEIIAFTQYIHRYPLNIATVRITVAAATTAQNIRVDASARNNSAHVEKHHIIPIAITENGGRTIFGVVSVMKAGRFNFVTPVHALNLFFAYPFDHFSLLSRTVKRGT